MSNLNSNIIDLDISDTTHEINLNEEILEELPSVNFGGGIELLMNDKRKNENKNVKGSTITR